MDVFCGCRSCSLVGLLGFERLRVWSISMGLVSRRLSGTVVCRVAGRFVLFWWVFVYSWCFWPFEAEVSFWLANQSSDMAIILCF